MLSRGETKGTSGIWLQQKVKLSQRQIHSANKNKKPLEVVNYIYEYGNELYM